MNECRMCENEIPGTIAPIDGLCAQCHRSLCQKGLGKCVRCAKIADGLVDDILRKKKDEDG